MHFPGASQCPPRKPPHIRRQCRVPRRFYPPFFIFKCFASRHGKFATYWFDLSENDELYSIIFYFKVHLDGGRERAIHVESIVYIL